MRVGIEALNIYGGVACVDIRKLFEERALDLSRFDNLLIKRKSVALPCEDPVTHGVNAAKPIVDRLSDNEKNSIEMLITATESGLDFGKSLSTYIHKYLGLSKHCRWFEVKQACYGGTAALQVAINAIAAQVSPGGKVLVVATDAAKIKQTHTYLEPSQAIGAVAMLVGENPALVEFDLGANGLYSYEVMDTCRPLVDDEHSNTDLSLLTYLDCLENAFLNYQEKVEGVCFKETFDCLAFHTPFAGMVKGAHRKMMRQLFKMKPDLIEDDFKKRVEASLVYCSEIGNLYSATIFMALASLIDNTQAPGARRVGMFSYGSGCSSEFYSGVIAPDSNTVLAEMQIGRRLLERAELPIGDYDELVRLAKKTGFGASNLCADTAAYASLYRDVFEGRGLLMLKEIEADFHRLYEFS
jgi:polyketide biosynthesis 3-hydroxy-3-methylglutaryl-CoA synthase-like enzyme PksG